MEIGVLCIEVYGLLAIGGCGVPLFEGEADAADEIVGLGLVGAGLRKWRKEGQGLICFTGLQGGVGLGEYIGWGLGLGGSNGNCCREQGCGQKLACRS
jgi:hypothetical protein